MDLLDHRDIRHVKGYLPTTHDVLAGVKFLVKNKQFGSLYHTGIQKFLPSIARYILELWTEAQIPTLTEKSVVHMIKKNAVNI